MDTVTLNKLSDWAIKHRRHLHQYPELSGQEFETCEYIKKQLREMEIDLLDYQAPNVVGYLNGTKGSTTIALRADMDALPIVEEGEKKYISKKYGISHACGHDGHMAILLAVAKWLSENRHKVEANIVFIFQSSEETSPSGAEFLIKQGVLEDVNAIFGIHLWQPLQKGKVGICSGAMMASVDDFRIRIEGKGGHGGMPHETIDSVYISSLIVNAIQSIISRRVDTLEPAVISIGKIEAGDSYNIIPAHVSMYGAIRTLSHDIRYKIRKEMENIVEGICSSFGAKGYLDILGGVPPLINDEKLSLFVEDIVKKLYGSETFVSLKPTMASEDFSYYLAERKGAFIFVGVGGEKSSYPHHHPKFDIDEDALETAINLLIKIALNYKNYVI